MSKSISKYVVRIMAFIVAFAMLFMLAACDDTPAPVSENNSSNSSSDNTKPTLEPWQNILQKQLAADLKLRGFSDISKATFTKPGYTTLINFNVNMGNCDSKVTYAPRTSGYRSGDGAVPNQAGFPCDNFHCVYANDTFSYNDADNTILLPRLSLDGIDVFGADATYDHIHDNVKIYQRVNPDIIKCFPDLA